MKNTPAQHQTMPDITLTRPMDSEGWVIKGKFEAPAPEPSLKHQQSNRLYPGNSKPEMMDDEVHQFSENAPTSLQLFANSSTQS